MIKQFIPHKICLACLGCCRFSQKDSVWTVHNLPLCRTQAGFRCYSLDLKNNKCRIYARRPFECRLYPFLINRQGNKVFLALDLNCPFAGKNFQREKFKKYAKYLAASLNRKKFLDIFKNNPRIIKSYSGVFDIAQLKVAMPDERIK